MELHRRVLGIETSCDETAAAVVDLEAGRLLVRASVVGSQTEVHAEYGGVVPELASRAHLERLLPVIRSALAEAHASLDSLHAVAVGSRPGLIGSLLVGTSAAKALSWALGKPFLGVDHVAAHLVAALLDAEPIPFPALGLVVSGGHTSLFHMRDVISLELVARTPDDAVGEAFDKGAALLGLPYPGGPEVERCAASGNAHSVEFPVPKVDFSFSGLKTALLHKVRGIASTSARGITQRPRADAPGTPARAQRLERVSPPIPMNDARRADLAASYQRALVKAVTRGVEHVWARRFEACDASTRPRSLIVGGGVAANRLLRSELARVATELGMDLRMAPMIYCVDNAAMIAGLGALRAERGDADALDLAPQPLSAFR